jgi:uncharacterized GH25 family protein
MKLSALVSASLLALAAAAPAAQAHRMWILPSSTVLSGEDPWITVDAAVSNDLFFADHVPMQLQAIKVYAPDGSEAALQNGATGKYRSTFDVQLKTPGTWRIVNANEGAFASYTLNGETKRWRGSVADVANAVPQGATNVRLTHSTRRVETFVTRGAPTTENLKPTGKGLELEPISHPNDLFAGEAAKFRLLADGKPAAGVKVSVVRGDARFAQKAVEMELTAGPDGVVEITWPEAGRYWLEAEATGGASPIPNAQRSLTYVAVLEVLNN